MGREQVRRIKTTIEDVVTHLVCNQCGARHKRGDHNSPLENNIHLFTAGGGYGTDFPGDMQTIEFGLCSTCLLALVDGFQVPVPIQEGMGVPPYEAKHTEHELATWVIEGGWAYPKGECPWEPWSKETSGEWQALAREREELLQDLEGQEHPWPTSLVYRHFKSRGDDDHLYEVKDIHIFDARTHEPLLVYRALYGDSTTYLRPLAMWGERVTRDTTPTGPYDGPRFRPFDPMGG